MAEKGKFIVDEALLESKEIEKAFQANAKEILARTMGSEIEEMVKESLNGSKVGLTEDEDDEEMDLELDMDDMEGDEDAGDAGDDLDLDLGDDEDLELGDMEGEDEDMDLDMEPEMDDEDLEVVDLTDADDEEVINVFKKMSPEDEIEVVQDGGNIDIKDNATGAEYRIELGGSEMEGEDEDMDLDMDLDMDMDSEEGEDEVEYHIELEDEDEENEVEESTSHTMTNRHRHNLKPANLKTESTTPRVVQLTKENTVLKTKVTDIQKENEQLKEDYNKMVDALKQFRTKLNEVAVFNSNLTYAVRLFTENTTTREEKVDIIKRFDDVKSLKESKNVYKQLVNEVSKKAPIKESIEEKLNVTKTSGSAETKINESQVYVNPELEKMKKLWSYDYKK